MYMTVPMMLRLLSIELRAASVDDQDVVSAAIVPSRQAAHAVLVTHMIPAKSGWIARACTHESRYIDLGDDHVVVGDRVKKLCVEFAQCIRNHV